MSQGVIFYQAVIFGIILVAARFGRSALNRTTLALVVFTVVHVFMPWLMILQFGTIFIAYKIGTAVTSDSRAPRPTGADDPSSGGTPNGENSAGIYPRQNANLATKGHQVAEVKGKYEQSGDTKQERKKRRSFHDFRSASAYAKQNPGTKIVRNKNGKFVVES